MKQPVVMINFKTYNEASGDDAFELVNICAEVKKETKHEIICCVQAFDVHRCSKKGIAIYGQHFDIEDAGGHTGKLTLKALIENGAKGCLVNHSENRIPFTQIMKTVALLQEAGLSAIVCVKNEKEAKKIAKLQPDAIAIEPPELIGGDISVTSANPEIISKSVQAVHSVHKHIPILCGAGVKTKQDVQIALSLGASGILVASGVTKAKNKKKEVKDLVKGLGKK